MWFKRKPSVADDLDDVDPIESLRTAAKEHGVDPGKLRLSIPLGETGSEVRIERNEVWASDGTGHVLWRVVAMRPLFRGDRRTARWLTTPWSTSCSSMASRTTSCCSAR